LAKANTKIQIPVKPFAMFIDAASKWLVTRANSPDSALEWSAIAPK